MKLSVRLILLVAVGALLVGSGVAFMAATAPPKPDPKVLQMMQGGSAGQMKAQPAAAGQKAGMSCSGEEAGGCSGEGGACSIDKGGKAPAAAGKPAAKTTKPAAKADTSKLASKPATKSTPPSTK